MLVPEEINFLVTSDPSQGAKNVTTNGSRFYVKLEEPIEVPKDALNATLTVEESTVWWTVPNIITGENDKLYVHNKIHK
jgi:hypothetical protein